MQTLIPMKKAIDKLGPKGCIHIGHLVLKGNFTMIGKKAYITKEQLEECRSKDRSK